MNYIKTKPEYYYKQSAVIPFRIKDKEVEVLLITSRKKKKWIIPKGIIEPSLSPQESAIKEAVEEAGIFGKIDNELFGSYSYKKWGDLCEVQIYLLEVTKMYETWQEKFRTRKWVKVKKAFEMIDRPELRSLILQMQAKVIKKRKAVNGK